MALLMGMDFDDASGATVLIMQTSAQRRGFNSYARLPAKLLGQVARKLYRELCHVWISVRQAFILRTFPKDAKRLIIFLTPGYNLRSGGVMAIAAHYRESLQMSDAHRSTVILCSYPDDTPFLKYNWFTNSNYILPFDAVLRRFRGADSVLVHIPEYFVNQFVIACSARRAVLSKIPSIQLNVLLQNIDQIGGQDLGALAQFGTVTCTTAHEAYSTTEMREKLGVPLHRLSVRLNFEQYIQVPYERKQPLLVVSPDEHPLKEQILAQIRRSMPGLAIKIIRGLSYREYLELISRAKWSLTFGEGLDGYFAEPIFSRGVSFAVYNSRFFTPEYAKLECIYPSWEALQQRLIEDLRRIDNPQAYSACSQKARDLLMQKYNNEEYRQNLRHFYQARYTCP